MKRALLVGGPVFALALALLVAPLLSSEARAMAAGVALGFLAAIPTVATLTALLRQERARNEERAQPPAVPPAIVVLPRAAQAPQLDARRQLQ